MSEVRVNVFNFVHSAAHNVVLEVNIILYDISEVLWLNWLVDRPRIKVSTHFIYVQYYDNQQK